MPVWQFYRPGSRLPVSLVAVPGTRDRLIDRPRKYEKIYIYQYDVEFLLHLLRVCLITE